MKKKFYELLTIFGCAFLLLATGCKNNRNKTTQASKATSDSTISATKTNPTTKTSVKEYSVSFNTSGVVNYDNLKIKDGNKIGTVDVKTVENYVFLGWFKDSDYKESFDFDGVITEDTVVYGLYVQDLATKENYKVTVTNGEDVTELTAYDGVLYGLNDPDTPADKVFEGYFVSKYNDANKLSYKFSKDTVVTENLSLYAVYSSKNSTGSKLNAPVVDVKGNTVSWTSVNGALQYKLTVTSGDETVVEKVVASTNETVDFANLASGDYVVSVVAIAQSAENNSDACLRYVLNKSLDRVSNVTITNGVISWTAINNATEYLVTVVCGNAFHNHTNYSVSNNTSYDFSGCDMKDGGITFVITAKANGYNDSVSEEFKFVQSLANLTNLAYDADNAVLTWDNVTDAKEYLYKVYSNDEVVKAGAVNENKLDLTSLDKGAYKVEITPYNDLYVSTKTAIDVNKALVKTPNVLSVNNDKVVLENLGENVTYIVLVGDKEFTSNTNEVTISTDGLDLTKSYKMVVKAKVDNVLSAPSKEYDVQHLALASSINYNNHILSWNLVIGNVDHFDVMVGTEVINVGNVYNYTLTSFLTEGVNTVKVRFNDGTNDSEWVTLDVTAYKVELNLNGAVEEVPNTLYLALGDEINLPALTKAGYTLDGFYFDKDGDNLKKYNYTYLNEAKNIKLNALYKANTYEVTLVTDAKGVIVTTKFEVVYGEPFELEVPTVTENVFTFDGWYALQNANGEKLTDNTGKSINNWHEAENKTIYAFYRSAVDFVLLTDNTYEVTKGNAFAAVTDLYVPAQYDGKPVTTINADAFNNNNDLVTVTLPNSIKYIDDNAFSGCNNITSFTIFDAGTAAEDVVFFSENGVIYQNNKATSEVWIKFVPKGLTGELVVKDGTHVVPLNTFTGASVTKVTLPNSLIRIDANAFQNATNIKEIVLSTGENENTLVISEKAFNGCASLEKINLTKNVNLTNLNAFNGCSKLTEINVDENNANYQSINGVLVSKDKTKLVLFPQGITGSYTIPSSITEIQASAFSILNADTNKYTNQARISEVIIHGRVQLVGEGAFAYVSSLQTVKFEGGIPQEQVIANNAFRGCTITTLVFGDNTKVKSIGDYAFSGIKVDNLVIPATLDTISTYAFGLSEIKNVTFKGATDAKELSIGDYAFYNSKIESVTFEENSKVKVLGKKAFSNNLFTAITLPNTLASIGVNAFDLNDNLKTVTINTVNCEYKLENKSVVFQSCANVENIVFGKDATLVTLSEIFGIKSFKSVDVTEGNANYVKNADGSVCSKDGTKLIFAAASSTISVGTDDDSITTIDGTVYANNTSILKVFIGKNITSISDGAFKGCTALIEVEFEDADQALTLGASLFEGCTALTTVKLSNRVTTIPDKMFSGCTALETIDLTNCDITSVGTYAFQNCTVLKNVNFKVADTAVTFGTYAFSGCVGLETITLPNGTTALSDRMFVSCTSLKTIDLTNTAVKTIGTATFNGCKALTTVKLSKATETVTTGNYHSFIDCTALTTITVDDESESLKALNNVLYTKDGKTLLLAAPGITGEFTVPNTVTLIKGYSFYKVAITSLKFETGASADTETTIEANAFSESALTSAEIGTQVVLIDAPAFNKCKFASFTFADVSKEISEGAKPLSIYPGTLGSDRVLFGSQATLTTLVLPQRLTYLGGFVLYNNTTVETVVIPKSVSAIGSNAFNGSNVKTVTFEEGSTLEAIPSSLFGGCKLLETINNLPNTVKSIGSGAFTNCEKLLSVNIPGGIGKIASGLFSGCTSLKTVTIGNGITEISSNAFKGCTSLVSITIPASVQYIGTYSSRTASRATTTTSAFEGCTSLKDVIFDDIDNSQLQYIMHTSFKGCTALESITLPASLKYLYDYAFSGCTKLKNVTFKNPNSITTLATYVFNECTALETIVLPQAITTIPNYVCNNCSSLTTITLPKGLTAWNTTAFSGCSAISTFVIDESNATFKCSGPALIKGTELSVYAPGATNETFAIPATVTSIAASAFAGCETIKTITYGGTSLTVSDKAFQNCANLESFDFTNVVKVGANAFEGTKLSSVSLGNAITAIGNYAFYNCKSLASVDLEYANTTTIGTYVFSGCSSLASVKLPNASTKFTKISDYMFEDCTGLKALTIPSTITSLGANPFVGCLGLNVTADFLVTENDVIYNADKTIIYAYVGAEGPFAVPAQVKTISTAAFKKSLVTELSVVTTDRTARLSIGTSAFESSLKLTKVVLSQVSTLNNKAFYGCSAITEFDLGNTQTINNYVFQGCTSLMSIIIDPDYCTYLGGLAFWTWTKDQKVYIIGLALEDCLDEDGYPTDYVEPFVDDSDGYDGVKNSLVWEWERP